MSKQKLPKGWEKKKLGEVLHKTENINPVERPNTEFAYIDVSSVNNNSFTIEAAAFLKGKDAPSRARKLVRKNDVIFATVRPTLRRIAMIPKKYDNQICSTGYFVLRGREIIENKLLFYYLQTDVFLSNMERLQKGASYPAVTDREVRDQLITFPNSLPEQRRIVAILDKAFAAIDKAKENAEKNLANSRELFESYLQRVFANPGKDWEEKKLGEVCEKITKGSSPKWQGIKYVDEFGILFITSENVGTNEIILKKRKFVEKKFNIVDKKSILENGDVLTNIVGASIGRTAIFNLSENANINQAVCLLRCDKKYLHNKYLTYLLNSPFFRNILHNNEIDNARANLSLGFFNNLNIPLPHFSEQKCIVSKLDTLSAETKRLEKIYYQKLTDLKELKQSVLQKAFEREL